MDDMVQEITTALPPLLGESPAFVAMLESVSALAPVPRPVVVVGERGTGKELVAARLHYLSPRWDGPFVKVNCAALSESLLDAELFGHEAGAFTGATRRRLGRFEAAAGGTLFLDEVGTAPLAVQEKILRVVEYGEFERIGSSTTQYVDVRIVCATNADLPAMAADGSFRADLLDRLAFAVVTLPPLRERPDDVALLAEHFARTMTREMDRPYFAGFTHEALQALQSHSWPGNIRELKNVVERAVALSANPAAPVSTVLLNPFPKQNQAEPALPHPPTPPVAEMPGFDERLDCTARSMLSGALEAARFNQKDAARRLGLDYHRFRRLLRKHGLG